MDIQVKNKSGRVVEIFDVNTTSRIISLNDLESKRDKLAEQISKIDADIYVYQVLIDAEPGNPQE